MNTTASQLYKKISKYDNLVSQESLNKAYLLSKKAHLNQYRGSGEEYFTHPLAVANFLVEMKLDSSTIITALLHDVVEDSEITIQDISDEFGIEISRLVDGVTKLSKLDLKFGFAQAENFRKLLLASSDDIRVLLVKLADRLHNMRTIHFVKDKEKIIRKAKETMEIYAPLADRMGMNRIRDELEDLSFSVLNKPARDLILDLSLIHI